jgi:chaperonin GroEL
MKEKKDRVDDALHATKAAIEEGIVPGGGVALLLASQDLSRKNTGSRIVRKACAKPFNQILVNAGYNSTDATMLGKYKLVESGNDQWAGIEVDSGEVVNFKEKGVIDPTKVTRLALQNAASVAGTVLLTECTVVDDISDKKEDNNPINPMAGMM